MIAKILILSTLNLLVCLYAKAQKLDKKIDYQLELNAAGKGAKTHSPPSLRDIPKGPFGDMVRLGHKVFTETDKYAAPYVGNKMKCVNCHLNHGLNANSAPMWAAYGLYPTYRKKNAKVNSFADRVQGCFKYSMNGTKEPPANGDVIKGLMAYSFWSAKGAPAGVKLNGRGYIKLKKPPLGPNKNRGKVIYDKHCVFCHAEDGQGRVSATGEQAFPPLWGENSFNWGAGMHRINTAAGFIIANMPFGQPNILTEQEAWDVAKYINSYDRPKDPRQKGSIKEAKEKFHKHDCEYGSQN